MVGGGGDEEDEDEDEGEKPAGDEDDMEEEVIDANIRVGGGVASGWVAGHASGWGEELRRCDRNGVCDHSLAGLGCSGLMGSQVAVGGCVDCPCVHPSVY